MSDVSCTQKSENVPMTIDEMSNIAYYYISEMRGAYIMPDDIDISHSINCKLQDKGIIGKIRPNIYCYYKNGVVEIRKESKGVDMVVYSRRIPKYIRYVNE